MPRHKKSQRESKRSNSSAICGDITVNDFANTKLQNKFRPKKSNVKAVLKEVHMLKLEDNDKAWDEKDDDSVSDEEGNCNEHRTGHKKRKNQKAIDSDVGEGISYPIDVWFLISEHIRPEDVSRFATICHTTYLITRTARFWFTMYRRHHTWVPELPENLTIWNMDNVKGLRAAVIRSLFYMYLPFCARIAAEKPLSSDPTHLLRSHCVLQWHRKVGTHHKYFFKFTHTTENRECLRNVRQKLAFDKRANSLLNFNPENGCYILEATCSAVCATAMVIGEYLYHSGLGLSANLCNHRLRLCFVPAHLLPISASCNTRKYQIPSTEILLDPVSDVRIYPWWHPKYWQCWPETGDC